MSMTGLTATFPPSKPARCQRPAVAIVARQAPVAPSIDHHALAYAIKFACAMSATTLVLGLAVYLV